MDILRFSIILLLVIGLIPLAAAPPSENADNIVHVHTLSGTSDTINTAQFVFEGQVTDVVTSNSTSGVGMWFVWNVDGSISQLGYTSVRQPDGSYKDKYEPFEGNWIINAHEVDDTADISINNNWITFTSGLIKTSDSDNFTVSPLPEFTFGSLIAMLFAGMIYLMIRRNVDRSANVNR